MKRLAARPRTCAHAHALALAAALAALAAPRPVRAQQTCSISTSIGLAFGTYDPFATTPLDSTAQIQFRCPPGPKARLSLDAGSSGTFAARELRAGNEVLRYNLYADAARTVVWGDGTGGSSIGPLVVVNGASGTVAYVFGRIPAGQDPVVAVYQDLIRVTLDL
jgi:spore coat protein U domain-containing protein, fimbrial subunit CupE1/2/3/6